MGNCPLTPEKNRLSDEHLIDAIHTAMTKLSLKYSRRLSSSINIMCSDRQPGLPMIPMNWKIFVKRFF